MWRGIREDGCGYDGGAPIVDNRIATSHSQRELKPIRKKTDQNLDVWIIVCIFAAEIDKKNEQRRFLGIRTYNHFRGLHS